MTIGRGIGFIAGLTVALTIAFIVLKLVGVIAWSWWWVLSPLWITAGIAVLAVEAVAALTLIAGLAGKGSRR